MLGAKNVSSPSELADRSVSRAQSKKEHNPYKGQGGLKRLMSYSYTGLVDDMHPFWNYNRAYQKTKKTVNYGKDNPYKLALNAKDASSRAASKNIGGSLAD